MTVVIKKIDNNNLLVNQKAVYKDNNGNWVSRSLNQIEAEATNEYIASLEDFNKTQKK